MEVYWKSVGPHRVYYLEDPGELGHPWFVSPMPTDEGWSVKIAPGFVGGIDPRCPEAERRHKKDTGEEREIGLCDEPEIRLLAWADVPSPFPFFLNLGAKAAPKENFSISGEFVRVDMTQDMVAGEKTPNRTLKQCEIYLTQARATYRLDVTSPGNILLGNVVDYALTFDSSALANFGARARISASAEFPKSVKPTFAERLAGAFQDDGMDHLPVATVFALSPEQDEQESGKKSGNPSSSWSLFVQHKLFWNVNYLPRNDPPRNLRQSTIDPFLAFFVGRYTFAPMATQAALEAESQRAFLALLNNTSNEGKFWTV